MLKGKTALVTGSTSGIGLGIAKALAQQGANIVLNGFGDVDRPKAEVAALGVRVEYHGADMSKPDEIEDMMKFAATAFGRVDILVNNAGIQHVAKVEDFPPERWDAIMAINLSSAFHTTRLAMPAMREANWGRVHQHRLGARARGIGAEIGLRRCQARHGRPDQGSGPRNGHYRRDLQCDLPGLGAYATGAKADR